MAYSDFTPDRAPRAFDLTEARSEHIVKPVRVEPGLRLLEHRVNPFAGNEFDVAPERGPDRACEFIPARSPSPWVLNALSLGGVEAKKDLLKAGLGRCVASMIAARLLNERQGNAVSGAYGAVTTGMTRPFPRPDGRNPELDGRESHLERIDKILGILTWMLSDEGGRARRVA
jgi:hypothetical protein